MSNLEQSNYEELAKQALQVMLDTSRASLYDLKEQRDKKIGEMFETDDTLLELQPRLEVLKESYYQCFSEVNYLDKRQLHDYTHPFIKTSLSEYLDCKEQCDSLSATISAQRNDSADLQEQIDLLEAYNKLLSAMVLPIVDPLYVSECNVNPNRPAVEQETVCIFPYDENLRNYTFCSSDSMWTCQECTYTNYGGVTSCDACGNRR